MCNNAFAKGNGLSAAILNTKERLRARGVDARIMTSVPQDAEEGQPDFTLKHFHFPLFEPVIRANGFRYAQISHKRLREAIDWADIVHLEENMLLEAVAVRLAQKMGKPCVASFHLFPQNITANLNLPRKEFISPLIIKFWNHNVLNHCQLVHCPSETAKRYLVDNGVKTPIRVISNGTRKGPETLSPLELGGRYPILCIGRLANEKSQQTLLEAVRYSKYAHLIDLQFAGKGPKEKKYRRMAEKLYEDGVLKIRPTFGFYDAAGLCEMARKAYLYIHCAWVEVEGLSCLDALREGAVPVIGESPLVGTTQFALCPESLYPQGDAKALAQRIDWWIEHPEEQARMREAYRASAAQYEIGAMFDRLIEMYHEAMA